MGPSLIICWDPLLLFCWGLLQPSTCGSSAVVSECVRVYGSAGGLSLPPFSQKRTPNLNVYMTGLSILLERTLSTERLIQCLSTLSGRAFRLSLLRYCAVTWTRPLNITAAFDQFAL